jgi:hypothetical protein
VGLLVIGALCENGVKALSGLFELELIQKKFAPLKRICGGSSAWGKARSDIKKIKKTMEYTRQK